MKKVPILMYHRITTRTDAPDYLTVPLQVFTGQMAFLAEKRIKVFSLDEFLNLTEKSEPADEDYCVITFDDGYGTTCELVEDVLSQFGFMATVFITTGTVGQPYSDYAEEGVLTWDRLRSLKNFKYGSHSVSHPRLTLSSTLEIKKEVNISRQTLEQELGYKVQHFAYPFGGYNSRVIDEVRNAGYLSACAVHRGPAKPGEDSFKLHRITVNGYDDPDVFKRKILTGFGSDVERNFSVVRDTVFSIPGIHDLTELWYSPKLDRIKNLNKKEQA